MSQQLQLAILSVHSSPIGNVGARDTGGMSIYIREVAREMGRRGVAIDIFTRIRSTVPDQIVGLGENVRLVHLPAGDAAINKLAVYPHLPRFTASVQQFSGLNHRRYDLVFSHYWLSGWVGHRLQRYWQVPHLMMFHTMGAVKNHIGIGEREPELRIATERQLAQSSKGIIAATEREKSDIVGYYGASAGKIRVIPCGVNMKLFHVMDKTAVRRRLGFDGEKVLLFVGRIEPLKGLDRLIPALGYLNRKARLVIIGGDEHSQAEVARLKGQAEGLGLTGSVNFLGRVNHEELPAYYNAADVCVVPSHYESFGLVALESLACGTPVVANNVGNLKNIIRQGETGCVVASNEPEQLAEGISWVLAKSDHDAVGIRASVNEFSWSRIAGSILAECQQVLGN